MNDRAWMLIVPICPECGDRAMFNSWPWVTHHDDLVGVTCGCGWKGVSYRAVPQPAPVSVRDDVEGHA